MRSTAEDAAATSDGHERASAATTAGPRNASAGRGSTRLTAIAAALACVVAALYLGLGARDAARLQHANDLGNVGDYAGAARVARSVSRKPAKARAQLVEAYAFVEAGDDRSASKAFARAAAADPNNWIIYRDWASALSRLGNRGAALEKLAVAQALNPRMPLPPDINP